MANSPDPRPDMEFCWACVRYHRKVSTGLEHLEGDRIRLPELQKYYKKTWDRAVEEVYQ